MFDNLSGLGYGLVSFAIIIGIGTVLIQRFNASVGCPAGYVLNESATSATDACYEATNVSNTTDAGTAGSNLIFMNNQLGSSGLAGWTPAIIAFAVGMLFLGAFLIGKKRKY